MQMQGSRTRTIKHHGIMCCDLVMVPVSGSGALLFCGSRAALLTEWVDLAESRMRGSAAAATSSCNPLYICCRELALKCLAPDVGLQVFQATGFQVWCTTGCCCHMAVICSYHKAVVAPVMHAGNDLLQMQPSMLFGMIYRLHSCPVNTDFCFEGGFVVLLHGCAAAGLSVQVYSNIWRVAGGTFRS